MATVVVDRLVTELFFQSKGIGTLVEARRQINALKRDGRESILTIRKLREAFLQLAAVRLVFGVVRSLGAALFGTMRTFESLRASLKTVTGGAAEATAAFDMIRKAAKSLPFTVEEITRGFIRLRGLGIEPTQKVLESLSNTASATQKQFMQWVEAVADASTFEFERLKEFGITARQSGDKVTIFFQNGMYQIERTTEAIQDFLLTQVGLKTFGGASAGQMNTLNGILSNTVDNLQAFAERVGENGLMGPLKELLTFVRDLTGDSDELADALGGTLGAAVESVTHNLRQITHADIRDSFRRTIRLIGELLQVFLALGKALLVVVEGFGGPMGLIASILAAKAAVAAFNLSFAATAAGATAIAPALSMAGFAFGALGIAIGGASAKLSELRSDLQKMQDAQRIDVGAGYISGFDSTTNESLAGLLERIDKRIASEESRIAKRRKAIDKGVGEALFGTSESRASGRKAALGAIQRGERAKGRIKNPGQADDLSLAIVGKFMPEDLLVDDSGLKSLEEQRRQIAEELARRDTAQNKRYQEREEVMEFARSQSIRNHEIAQLVARHRRGDLTKKERERLAELQRGRNEHRARVGLEALDVIDPKDKGGPGKEITTAFSAAVAAEVEKQSRAAALEAGRAALSQHESLTTALSKAKRAALAAKNETLRKIESGEIEIPLEQESLTSFDQKLQAEVDRQVAEAAQDAGSMALHYGLGIDTARRLAKRAADSQREMLQRQLAEGTFAHTPELATLLRQAGLSEQARHVTPPIIHVALQNNDWNIRVDAPIKGEFRGTPDDLARAVAEVLPRALIPTFKKALDALATREVR